MKKGKTRRRNLPHIADRLFDVPLLMHPRKMRSIVGVMGSEMGIGAYLQPEILAAVDDDFLTVHTSEMIPAGYGIAVIPVHGTLVQRGDSLDAMSGLLSYEAIREDLREMLCDPAVDAILLDIDSGGGEVAGLFDLVAEIAAAEKPVYAFANEGAYSAAYAIASAAKGGLFLPRTGGVGSIGVVAVHIDQSAFDQKQGFSYTPIFAGARKIDGWGHGPLTDDAKAEFQKSVDLTYQIFVETVAANRGLTQKAVQETQAACFTAQEAVDIGLADDIGTFEDVIQLIAQELQDSAAREISGQGGRKALSGPSGDHSTEKGPQDMKKLLGRKRADVKNPVEDDEKTIAAAVAGKKKGADDAPDEDEEDDEDDSENDDADSDTDETDDMPEKKKAQSDAAEIADLCTLFGKPDMAASFIRKGVTAPAVRRHLLKQRNEDAEATRTAGGSVISANQGTAAKPTRLADQMHNLLKQKGMIQ